MLSIWVGRKLAARTLEILEACDTDTGTGPNVGKKLGETSVGEGLVELRKTLRILDRATEIAEQDLSQASTRAEKDAAREVLKQFADLRTTVSKVLAQLVALKPRAEQMEAERRAEQQERDQ